MRPPIRYFGAKGNLADALVALMPQTRGYIEPFAGSLAVLLAREPVKVEVVNDLDGRLMTFWRVLRDRPDEFIQRCALTPHSRAETIAAAELDGDSELELARQVYVMLTQGRAGTLRKSGWRFYADSKGANSGFAQYMRGYLSRLAPAAERLIGVALECRPALEVIEQYGAFEENLLYVDPPYVGSTLTGGVPRYTETMTDEDHFDLATELHKCKAKVMISGYASDLYFEMFHDWYGTTLRAHAGNAADRERDEMVWCNYPLDVGRLFVI